MGIPAPSTKCCPAPLVPDFLEELAVSETLGLVAALVEGGNDLAAADAG